MRLPIIALAITLLASIVPEPASAQLGTGVLDVWLKAHESADAPNDQKVTLYKKSKALVIGMDHYGNPWPQLSNAIKDAEQVAKALSGLGFEVTLKKDLKSEELDRTLRNFFVREGFDVDARLLLWFAGHGYTVRDEGYIVPVDAPSPKADADFRDKAISLRRFGEYMREAYSRHVLAIFDSCFAGTVFNTARSAPPPAITLATTETVREFISSGEADQQVSDDGTFRKLFLDVLAGKEPDADANHDGYVTGTELGLFLHQKITNLTYNRQTPRYGKLNALGYDRGDFVFQVGKPDVPTTAPVPTPQPTSEAAQAWALIQNTTSIAVLEDFNRHFGDSFYASIARARLQDLKTNQVTPAPLPEPPTPRAPVVDSTQQAWATVRDTTNTAVLVDFIRQYGNTPYASMARARLEELKKNQIAVAKPTNAPATNPEAQESRTACRTIVGTWVWPLGLQDWTFDPDGAWRNSAGNTGKWYCDGKIVLLFTRANTSKQPSHRITISADGKSFAATGIAFTPTRKE